MNLIDLHAHILPGLDDGAKTFNEAIEIVQKEASEGVKKIVTLCHYEPLDNQPSKNEIYEVFLRLRKYLEEYSIPIEIFPASEAYFESNIVNNFKNGKLLTIADRRKHFFLELPLRTFPQIIYKVIFECKTIGLTPIIPHPERHPELMNNLEKIADLIERGALIQISADSLLGFFGRKIKKTAREIILSGQAHVLASDIHRKLWNPSLALAYEEARALIGNEAEKLVKNNPQKIIEGQGLD